MAVTDSVERWVDEAAGLTEPRRLVWCDGSKLEYDRLIEQMLADGTLIPLRSPGVSRLLSPPQPAERRGAHRAAHLHLHARAGRRGSDQQLAGAGRRPAAHRRAAARLDARPHDVRDSVSHGPGRARR